MTGAALKHGIPWDKPVMENIAHVIDYLRSIVKPFVPRCFAVRRLNRDGADSILLTFDDGPDPEVTPQVLERLKAHEARAVFFVVGRRIAGAPQLLAEIRRQGHLIGNHTFEHPNDRQPGFWDNYRDISHCQRLIEVRTGERPHLFRPSNGRITLSSLLLPKLLRLRTVVWSLEADDWQCRDRHQAHTCAAELLRLARRGDIMLLHDDNAYVIDILDEILPALKARYIDLYRGVDCL